MESKLRKFVQLFELKAQVRLYKPVKQKTPLNLTEEVNELLGRPEIMDLTLNGKYLKQNKSKLTWNINIDRSADYELSSSNNNTFEVMEWLASHI